MRPRLSVVSAQTRSPTATVPAGPRPSARPARRRPKPSSVSLTTTSSPSGRTGRSNVDDHPREDEDRVGVRAGRSRRRPSRARTSSGRRTGSRARRPRGTRGRPRARGRGGRRRRPASARTGAGGARRSRTPRSSLPTRATTGRAMRQCEHGRRAHPALRGVFHLWALWASIAAGIVLVVLADGALATFSSWVYAAALAAMFGASALYHRFPWQSAARRLWARRLDHSMIFLFIAGSYTPFALLCVRGHDAVARARTRLGGRHARARPRARLGRLARAG